MNAGYSGPQLAPRGRWDEVTVRPVWDWRAGPGMISQAKGEIFCVQTPGTPLMAMCRKGSKVEIGWEGGDEFGLEVAPSFRRGEVWKAVRQHPRRWANLNLVVVEASRGEQYFRLRRCGSVPPGASADPV